MVETCKIYRFRHPLDVKNFDKKLLRNAFEQR